MAAGLAGDVKWSAVMRAQVTQPKPTPCCLIGLNGKITEGLGARAMSMRKELLESAKEVAERCDLAGYLVIGWNGHESASIRQNGDVPASLKPIVIRDAEAG